MNGKDKESLISKQERAVKQQEILEKKRRLRAEYNLAAEKPGKKFLEWKGRKKEWEREPRIFAQHAEASSQLPSTPDSSASSEPVYSDGVDRGSVTVSPENVSRASGMVSSENVSRASGMVSPENANEVSATVPPENADRGSDRASAAVSAAEPQDRVSASQWFLSICWLKIPVIGILYALILAINPKAPYEKRNFARGYLLYRVMVWGLALTILYVVYQVGLGFVDDLLSYVK